MKLISFTVPCYNSEAYMSKCIDSLLVGGDDCEIIIVDDGSTDRTGEIADQYQVMHPNVVRVIHKENGGHGSAVNAGIENAFCVRLPEPVRSWTCSSATLFMTKSVRTAIRSCSTANPSRSGK